MAHIGAVFRLQLVRIPIQILPKIKGINPVSNLPLKPSHLVSISPTHLKSLASSQLVTIAPIYLDNFLHVKSQ